jgi:uncharacterized membrane protein SirB2
MVKYFNTPLKVTGAILMFAGFAFSIISFQHSLFLGVSVILLGLVVIITEIVLTRSQMKSKQRNTFEFFLVLLILCFAVMLALDYYGVIVIQNFLAIL